jgi:predicted nuclease of predicted toxin-antitoxin system
MRFLVGANLSPGVADWLRDVGHEATHVVDHDMLAASDQTILDHALASGQVIVSADTDFTIMLAVAGAKSPSLVLLRSANHLAPADQANLIIDNLPSIVADLEAGAVVSLSSTHLRVRRLPMA